MSAVNERIEYIYQSAVWLAEGVLIEACEEGWPSDYLAQAAREWHRTRELLAMSKRWREKVSGRPFTTFDEIEW
ncbi:hypothetical protein ELI54_02690 [Rhizobium ruizarguesonis]|uniref:hypothetical protein n=1 Tax=Rhizobium ruizarguesonis TaxID=2081791 RepID=UPI0010317697|nr:hypothetical protein [Rhizobium ruizarguesonis]TAT87201.1 hypothetical protein ELI54_02690 [Rhizobium ruizarguesonis]